MKRGSSRWTAVGWHHLYLEMPEDWGIGAVSGDASTGYLRIDDAEMPRIELRWEPARGQEPIDKVVERYLKNLTKKGRKKAPPIKVRRDLNLIKDNRLLENRAVEGFHWRIDGDEPIQAYGILWRCEVCSRIVFLQILGRAGESTMTLATRILNTLQDHPVGDTVVWAMYGMKFEIPVTCALKSHSFLTGQIKLNFTDKSSEIELERLSLAEMHLKGRSFEEWFQDTYGHEIETLDPLSEERLRHPGVQASGTTVDPETVHKRLAWLPWRRPRRRPFDSCSWHCTDGNKLYTLRRMGEGAQPEMLLDIAQSVVCH